MKGGRCSAPQPRPRPLVSGEGRPRAARRLFGLALAHRPRCSRQWGGRHFSRPFSLAIVHLGGNSPACQWGATLLDLPASPSLAGRAARAGGAPLGSSASPSPTCERGGERRSALQPRPRPLTHEEGSAARLFSPTLTHLRVGRGAPLSSSASTSPISSGEGRRCSALQPPPLTHGVGRHCSCEALLPFGLSLARLEGRRCLAFRPRPRPLANGGAMLLGPSTGLALPQWPLRACPGQWGGDTILSLPAPLRLSPA